LLGIVGGIAALYALVCTDETGVDRDSFEQAEPGDPIRSFEIESSGEWSSWVDGHGRIYRVRITWATGIETVEIRIQDANSISIQYADIKHQ
jgi:hypothetical protein